ncbi:11661_t:CDS:2 [Gigaspora rosea]|nr:11661_t:CDS:2 [Gigaspora rosea]
MGTRELAIAKLGYGYTMRDWIACDMLEVKGPQQEQYWVLVYLRRAVP